MGVRIDKTQSLPELGGMGCIRVDGLPYKLEGLHGLYNYRLLVLPRVDM